MPQQRKRGRELNEKHGMKCATQTGKVRSSQLEKGEPISLETIKRMASYLSRAEEYYDEGDTSVVGRSLTSFGEGKRACDGLNLRSRSWRDRPKGDREISRLFRGK